MNKPEPTWSIYWTLPGDISENGCWMIIQSCFMYTHEKLEGVIDLFLFEYQNDKHMIG